MKRSHLEATASDTEVNADDQDDDAGPSRPDSTHEPTAHEEDPRKRIKLDRAKAKKQRQKENRKAAAAAALAGAAVTCAANPPIQVAATKINPTESDARATLDATSQNKTDGTALTGESSSSRVERRLGSSVSVPLDEICFTQKDMSPRFNDTRTVPDLMQSFIDGLGVIPGRGGNATPVIGTAAARGGRSPFSVMPRIRAFTHPGVVQERWFSLDNRRLRAAVDASHVILFQYIEGELNKRALSPAQLLAAHVAESPSNAAAFELQMPGSSPLPLPRLPPISVEYCDVQRDVEAKKEFHKKNSNTAWSVGGALRSEELDTSRAGALAKQRAKQLNEAMSRPTTLLAARLLQQRQLLYQKEHQSRRNTAAWQRKSFPEACLALYILNLQRRQTRA